MLMMFVDEQAACLHLLPVQTRDGVKVHTSSDQLTLDDGWVALDSIEPLPRRPRGTHRGADETQRLLGSEQPACSCSFRWIVEIPRQSVGRICAREV